MLAMQNQQPSVLNPPPAVHPSGVGPFRCPPTVPPALNTVNSNALYSGSAVESPSSSDDSQSHGLNDDNSVESMNYWVQDPRLDSSDSNAFGMRRESDQTSPSSATSATFAGDINFNSATDSLEHGSPDALPPKIEELDEDGEVLMSVKPGGDHPADETSTAVTVNVPRKRGRPRKHPLPTPGGQAKIAKGRSKTGCITCRRRKKKCDETKPACKNHNLVIFTSKRVAPLPKEKGYKRIYTFTSITGELE